MDNEQKTVAYIIGNAFEALASLPNVYTINQVFSAMMENCLPKHSVWVVGQGIHVSVRELLKLCTKYRSELNLHFGSLALNSTEEYMQMQEFFAQEQVKKQTEHELLEWRNFHFIESTRVKADLQLVNISDKSLLAQDFLLIAARELSEKACRQVVSSGQLIIKHASINRFHQTFPLPMTVEAQFQLAHDNKRSLKSLTRFYQDYSCTAEVNLSFDLYSEKEANALLQTLGVKTFTHFSDKLEENN